MESELAIEEGSSIAPRRVRQVRRRQAPRGLRSTSHESEEQQRDAASDEAREPSLASSFWQDRMWRQHMGHELEPLLLPSRESSEQPPIALLDTEWLVEYAAGGGTLVLRQHLPPEAFIAVRRLKAGVTDRQPIIALSYPW